MSQGVRVSLCHCVRVSRSQGVKESGSQGVRESGSKRVKKLRELKSVPCSNCSYSALLRSMYGHK